MGCEMEENHVLDSMAWEGLEWHRLAGGALEGAETT